MSLPNGVSVRLDEDIRLRLQSVSDASGLKPSDLMRMAIEKYLTHIETTGQLTINVTGNNNISGNSNTYGTIIGSQVVNHIKKNSDQPNRAEAAKKAAAKNVAKVKGNGNKISQQ